MGGKRGRRGGMRGGLVGGGSKADVCHAPCPTVTQKLSDELKNMVAACFGCEKDE